MELRSDFEVKWLPRVSDKEVTSVSDVLKMFKPLGKRHQEEFWIVLLTTNNTVIGKKCINIGTTTSAIVDIQEIARCAILTNAQAILSIHNHPSGDPTPSQDDIRLANRLKDALSLFNIRLLDFIIISKDKDYSFASKNML